jgi:type 1 glutamine amidotransferase
MFKKLAFVAVAGLTMAGWLGLSADVARAGQKDKVRVVIIDGQNNHDWRSTTPLMKKALVDSGRFTVAVSSNIKPGDTTSVPMPGPFPPDLTQYDVVVSNYNGASWPKEFNDALDARLKEGKIGLVIVHAANNAFGGWKEYNQMIGMGWRDKNFGRRLKVDDAGKTIFVPAGEDRSTSHLYTGPFKINVRDANHPITKGMPMEWMHARDELYDNLRGPIENIQLLATGIAPEGKGTGVHEPMIFTISYGKGKVFHTPMGHDLNGMRCVGFVTTLQRGTEWAATGAVTLPIPDNFPTAGQESSLPK